MAAPAAYGSSQAWDQIRTAAADCQIFYLFIYLFVCLFIYFCLLPFLGLLPPAYGGSQARGLVGATAAGLNQT